ncbi:MAG: hypothetical protein RSE01_06890 [Akkermansia sp.]
MINRLLQGNMFLREEAPAGGNDGGGVLPAAPPAPATPSFGDVPPEGGGNPPPAGDPDPTPPTPPADGDDWKDYLASPEKLAAYREKMGIASDVSGYELAFSEGVEVSDSELAFLKQSGVELGIAPAALSKFVESYLSKSAEAEQMAEVEFNKNVEAAFGKLANEWGADYQAKCDNAKKTAEQLCKLAGVDPAFLKSNPAIKYSTELFAIFSHVSDLISEGKPKGLGGGEFQSATAEMRRIESDPSHPLHEAYMDHTHANHKYANDYYDSLALK